MEKRVEFDIWYMENWSLLLDIKIILKTAVKVFLTNLLYHENMDFRLQPEIQPPGNLSIDPQQVRLLGEVVPVADQWKDCVAEARLIAGTNEYGGWRNNRFQS